MSAECPQMGMPKLSEFGCLPPNLWPAADHLIWDEALRLIDLLEEETRLRPT